LPVLVRRAAQRASSPFAAVGETVADAWRPRSDAWLRREPSPFAGRPDRPLFIGACPRSGTTLLRSVLNNHPDLAMPPETDFVIPVWCNRARWGDLRAPSNRRALAEWIFDTPGRGGLRIRGRIPREEAIERVVAAPPALGSVIAACFELFAERKGKRRWGDKRPRYSGYLAAIFQLFPDAQFVNVVRDPRAAVASQVAIGLNGVDDELPCSLVNWETAVRRVDLFAEALRPDQLLDVRYEDMVSHPHRTLRRVCEFAGLRGGDAIEEMISRERRGNFNEGWHDRLAEPISAATIDSWRERLAPADVSLIEYATGRYFERFGYRFAPALAATPERRALRQLRRQRRARRIKWTRYSLGELERRRILYRHPVAALPRSRVALDRRPEEWETAA
jgi:sulfotransferase family protein